jgi:23S rRNA (guanine2445-N2)-methyltransferase / 23S rRNA (guanine2069-N7)-methyltransferase
MNDKDSKQLEFFRNRIAKNEKNLRRWAKREAVTAYRLYDRDIPEVPLSLDWYREVDWHDTGKRGGALCMALYDRSDEKDEAAEAEWISAMASAAGEILEVTPENVFARTKKHHRGSPQYERLGTAGSERIVREAGLSFVVNLSDYLDTGLFLDHRPLRSRVHAESKGKRVLNLFAYTGSFSVHAAAGKASQVTTVDLSKTYLAWAERNLTANGFTGSDYPTIRADVRDFLAEMGGKNEHWDLIIADPPTFSNSKAFSVDFDVNVDWPNLVTSCLGLLAKDGVLYFSTNSRRLKWEPDRIAAQSQDISESTIPPDFRDKRVHRAWRITRPSL